MDPRLQTWRNPMARESSTADASHRWFAELNEEELVEIQQMIRGLRSVTNGEPAVIMGGLRPVISGNPAVIRGFVISDWLAVESD
jgi:hypothetical protein